MDLKELRKEREFTVGKILGILDHVRAVKSFLETEDKDRWTRLVFEEMNELVKLNTQLRELDKEIDTIVHKEIYEIDSLAHWGKGY